MVIFEKSGQKMKKLPWKIDTKIGYSTYKWPPFFVILGGRTLKIGRENFKKIWFNNKKLKIFTLEILTAQGNLLGKISIFLELGRVNKK